MSRCFPFPPPGYEKKARPDDTDLLKKEKRREKKQNKEKDREKKDSNEKKEKDASEGKDKREKKDRKEKHRDKKKDKEKDRDKDKATSITSNEKKLTEKPKGRNGEIHGKNEDWKKVTNNSAPDKRFSGKSVGVNGEKVRQNNLVAYESKDTKFVQELGKRISDGDRAVENQSTTEKFMGADRRKDEVVAGFVAKDSGTLVEGNNKNKVKNGVDSRMGGPWNMDESEFGETPSLHKLPGLVHGNFEGIHRSLDKNVEKKMEGKGKAGKTEGGDEKRGGNHGDKNGEKKSQRKDKNRDKEKKMEEKLDKIEQKNGRVELKFTEHDTLKERHKNGRVGIHNNQMPGLSNDRHIIDSTDGNLRKRKAPETNGFLHDTETKLNERPWLDSSHISRPLVENGRVLEPSQTSSKVTSHQPIVIANNHIMDKKKQKINGMIEGQPVSSSSMKPASSIKPPHPDSKFLDSILSVPKVEELPDYDDQEWLFTSKKSKVGNSCSNETLQVWDKAMQIDSVDVCALPYVIPY